MHNTIRAPQYQFTSTSTSTSTQGNFQPLRRRRAKSAKSQALRCINYNSRVNKILLIVQYYGGVKQKPCISLCFLLITISAEPPPAEYTRTTVRALLCFLLLIYWDEYNTTSYTVSSAGCPASNLVTQAEPC